MDFLNKSGLVSQVGCSSILRFSFASAEDLRLFRGRQSTRFNVWASGLLSFLKDTPSFQKLP